LADTPSTSSRWSFTIYGFGVDTPEVDNEGIDFIIRQRNPVRYHDVQVKSDYIFMTKGNFDLCESLLLAVVLFRSDREPDLHVIPATAWAHPNTVFVDRTMKVGKANQSGASTSRGAQSPPSRVTTSM
jgi:hypothetical protein